MNAPTSVSEERNTDGAKEPKLRRQGPQQGVNLTSDLSRDGLDILARLELTKERLQKNIFQALPKFCERITVCVMSLHAFPL